MAVSDIIPSVPPDHPDADIPASEEASIDPEFHNDEPYYPASEPTASEPEPGDAELEQLRALLFSREIDLLNRLNAAFENPDTTTRKVSEVLAEAIHLRTGKDPHLAMALEPVVDAIVKASFNTRKADFVDALSPLMGPTIRKSMAESFQSMMGNFSKSVEMAFSWKGLKWRFQALRSGKPFSEIVMLNTLVYRVEQLFFIHRATGLVLSHVAGESVEAQDADMVSAMLTAIQDFARDCFSGGGDEELHSLKMGEFTIHIEPGSRAYLACVLRGTPPPEFYQHLRATLDLMHIEYLDALDGFNGDTAPFAGAVRHLESCLLSRYVNEGKKVSGFAKAVLAIVFLTLAAGVGYLYHLRSERQAAQAAVVAKQEAFTVAMRNAVDILRAEPGLMVTNVTEKQESPWELTVLKDASGRPPDDVLRDRGIDPRYFSIRVIPYVSYDPSIVVKRVRDSIRPPATVAMHFDEKGTLTFTGTAPMSWIVSAREDARAIPGVEHVDVSGVSDPMMARINAMVDEVEKNVIEFPLGRDTPVGPEADKLRKAVDALVQLESIARDMGFTASLTIFGHADAVGDAKRNYEISQARARTVASMLYAKGSSMPVAIYGMGAEHPRGDSTDARGESQASRRIELRVHFALSPSAKPEMFRK